MKKHFLQEENQIKQIKRECVEIIQHTLFSV